MNGMVSSASVEQACSEVSAYSDQRMAAEFERFFEEQPAVCTFVIEATRSSAPRVQELSLFLSYMVFKAARIGRPGMELPVTEDSIDASCRECERWIERIHEASLDSIENVRLAARDDEPHLVQYVIAELDEPPENDVRLNDDERGAVFFVLKTVIGSLSRKSYENKE
jgi:hypothetical protein